MSGPVKVARSPTPDMLALEGHMQGLAIGSRVPPKVPPRAPVAVPARMAPVIQAFFEKQQQIGARWPQALYPIKYDISIYRQADEGCYSSVDSKDWRKREISIRVTDAAIDFIDEVLRKPIAEASVKAWAGTTPQNFNERMQNHLVTKLPFSSVSDFTKSTPQETRCERKRFATHEKSSTVLIAVPQAKLLEIARRIVSYPVSDITYAPGPILDLDILLRLRNIFAKLMQPEIACLRSLIGNPSAPKITLSGIEQPFSEKAILYPLAYEIAWRTIKQGKMDPRRVDSLVEPYVLHEEKSHVEIIEDMIIRGQTGDNIGALSW